MNELKIYHFNQKENKSYVHWDVRHYFFGDDMHNWLFRPEPAHSSKSPHLNLMLDWTRQDL